MTQLLHRHSYSSVKMFERCPAAWAFSYVDLIKGKPGAAAERGTRIHYAAERYLTGEIPVTQLPVEYKPFIASMELAKQFGAKAEQRFFVGRDWVHLPQEDEGKEPKGSWLLAILDMYYFLGGDLHIVDLKTGQFNRDHEDQIEFYMVMASAVFPNVERVHGRCYYLDQGTVGHDLSYKANWLKMVRMKWAARIALVEKSLRAVQFPATPGPRSCSICSYRASRGGPCKQEFVRVPA